MKILHVTANFPSQGKPNNGVFILSRIEHLNKCGLTNKVVLLHHIDNKQSAFRRLENYNTNEFCLDSNSDVEVLNYIRLKGMETHYIAKRIKQLVKRDEIDIVHFHFAWAAYSGPILKNKYGIPYMVTMHGCDINTRPQKNKAQYKLTKEVLDHAQKLIFVSNALKKAATTISKSAQNGIVIPNGIKSAFFRERRISKAANRKKVVGYLGYLDPVKRVELIPGIYKKIHEEESNTRFVIAGEGSEHTKLVNKLNQIGIMTHTTMYPGFNHEELAKYLNEIDVLVMPSLREGFGIIALEAQAMGVPTVGSGNGGLPEAIGEGGVIIPEGPKLVSEFAGAVISLLHNPIEPELLISRAQKYDWKVIVEKEKREYENFI